MPTAASPIDRLSELLNIGAGHAAGALALLLGRTFWMRVPRALRVGADAAPLAGELALRHEIADGAALLFEVEGSPGGIVALFLPDGRAPGALDPRARAGRRRGGTRHARGPARSRLAAHRERDRGRGGRAA